MNFDPEVFSANQRNTLETDTARLGARYTLSPSSTFLVLYNYKKADITQSDQSVLFEAPNPPFPPGSDVTLFQDIATNAKSNQYEGAYIYQANKFNLLAGAAYTTIDRTDTYDFNLEDPLCIFFCSGPLGIPPDVTDMTDERAYIYGNFSIPMNVTWTLGVSYQKYKEDIAGLSSYDVNNVNPKLGVQWQVTDTLLLRGAYFEVMKPVLASNRTLEPTQIAGFNQYYDDVDATQSTRYGIGADWRASNTVSLGAEFTRRKLDVPVLDFGTVVFDNRDEWTNRAYGYWTPSDRWAVSAEAVYDKFSNDVASPVASVIPQDVRTISVPVKATYFHPSGVFAGAGVTYVDQSVSRSDMSTLPQGDSNFTLVDLSVGYRLPKRQGIAILAVRNLFDEDFMYQDDSYRQFGDEPSVSPYTPGRVIMGSVTLSF
jgi:hypothetical protein